MDTGKTLIARMQTHVAHWLVSGPATPLILTGTLAFAGLSAAALNEATETHGQPAHSYPSNCHPDPDGDGHLVCYVNASQLPVYSQGYCRPDSDSNGRYVCYVDPSGYPLGVGTSAGGD
jgi:hypothetical protein